MKEITVRCLSRIFMLVMLLYRSELSRLRSIVAQKTDQELLLSLHRIKNDKHDCFLEATSFNNLFGQIQLWLTKEK